ncbi:MAG: hypothetical protein Q7U21_06640, partial [Lutibacter sp.]|nr:hypothetical protein [Lutibacter sp.]
YNLVAFKKKKHPHLQQYFIPPELACQPRLVSGSADLKYNHVKYRFQFRTVRVLKKVLIFALSLH